MSWNWRFASKRLGGVCLKLKGCSSYYKLYVSKKMELRPYITYRAPVGTKKWKVYTGGAVAVVHSVAARAKKV